MSRPTILSRQGDSRPAVERGSDRAAAAKLRIRGLTKAFTEGSGVFGVDLEVAEGEFLTLLGPSGCGKTTLLRLIAGLLKPDEGEIVMDGQILSCKDRMTPPHLRGMAMVFQNYALWPHMNVFENVAFGLRRRGVPKTKIAQLVRQALELVDLAGYEGRLPRELSGGQQQRVALSRAIVIEPSLLLLDEPLSNLDARVRESMRSELIDLRARTGITFVYVTHDQEEALGMSDRVAVMDGGGVVQVGTPREVYDSPSSRVVADLVGSITWVKGLCEGDDGKSYRVRVGHRVRIELPPEQAPGLSVGRDVMVGVRPGAARIRDIEEGGLGVENLATGRITRAVYQGPHVTYVINCEGAELPVQASSDQLREVGTVVEVQIDPARCIVYQDRPDDGAPAN